MINFGAAPRVCVRIDKMQGIEGEGDRCLLPINDLARIPIIMRQFAMMTLRLFSPPSFPIHCNRNKTTFRIK